MKSWNFRNNSKVSLMKRLVRSYAIVLIIVNTLFVFLVIYQNINDSFGQIRTHRDTILTNISTQYYQYNEGLLQMIQDLSSDAQHVQSMKDYFYMDLSTYYRHAQTVEPFIFFPKEIMRLYNRYDNIYGFLVTMDDSNYIYYSNKHSKQGQKGTEYPTINNKISFTRILTNYNTYDPVGTITLLVDKEIFDIVVSNTNSSVDPHVFIVNSSGRITYSYGETDGFSRLFEDAHMMQVPIENVLDNEYSVSAVKLTNDNTLYVIVNNKSIILTGLKDAFNIMIGSLFIDFILLIVLFRTFGEYDEQVNDIMQSMDRVREGKVFHRVETINKKDELLDISESINNTLDSLNAYTKEIIDLEIRQQDINMRALQSQINPHFLYNTLEFIRMYAVTEEQEELAEIVYTFATLLRNNIALEKVATLKNELDFCEKYVYLHQMRYPDRIAYKFIIDEDIKDLQIPKFTIQPLIENYFVHGIDYSSIDNALSVEAYLIDDRVVITISDNGEGMSDEGFKDLQYKIDSSEIDISNSSSVGLLNVHERLKTFFKFNNYLMRVYRNKNNGFSVEISFDKEED